MTFTENIEQHSDWDDDLFELWLTKRWSQFKCRYRGIINNRDFPENESEFANSLKILSFKIAFMGDIVVKKEIVDIIFGNRVIESKLFEDLG